MDENYKKHGVFSWNELMTNDIEAAKDFYANLLGWQYEEITSPETVYNLIKVDGNQVGGIMQIPSQAAGTPPMWGSYVTVDDVDKLVEQTTKLGGKILVPARDIPDVGRFSVIQDKQGAVLTLITYTEKS